MSARFRRRMSDADALMWNIEADPLLRSTITAVAVLDTTPEWDAVVRRVARAAERIPRLRQRVQPPGRTGRLPEWVDDAGFDQAYHLRRVVAPAPGDLQSVLDLACIFAMGGFDRARPLWEFTLVEGLDGGRAALVLKLHHSLTDGVGGIRLATELYERQRHGHGRRSVPEPVEDVDRGTNLAATLARVPFDAARAGARLLRAPRRELGRVVSEASSVTRFLAPAPAKLSPLMTGRSMAWSFTAFDVPLEGLRQAGAAADGTVNDAYLAAVTGGLYRYHRHHGAEVPALRMTLPISLRTGDDPLGGNRFTPARFVVPVGITDPAERMRALGRLVRAWRAEPAVAMTDTLAAGLNLLPKPVVTSVFGGMLKNVDFVATNVPGLSKPMYVAGAEIVRQYAFAPPTGAAMNIALLSHVDTGCIGALVDRAAVPDPDVFTSCLCDAFAEVLALAPGRPGMARAS